jgi:hypothetical protein
MSFLDACAGTRTERDTEATGRTCPPGKRGAMPRNPARSGRYLDTGMHDRAYGTVGDAPERRNSDHAIAARAVLLAAVGAHGEHRAMMSGSSNAPHISVATLTGCRIAHAIWAIRSAGNVMLPPMQGRRYPGRLLQHLKLTAGAKKIRTAGRRLRPG